MNHITASENWLFEIKVVRAIRTNEYGKPYAGIASITIVDGEVHVEGLMLINKNKSDIKEIEQHIKYQLGFNEYYFSRYKNGEKRIIKRVIK